MFDYSQTINKYKELGAYPLPKIDEIVNKIVQYKLYSTIDFCHEYYQIPLSKADRPYTAFEGNRRPYQFT